MTNSHLVQCPVCGEEYESGSCEEDDEFQCGACCEVIAARLIKNDDNVDRWVLVEVDTDGD